MFEIKGQCNVAKIYQWEVYGDLLKAIFFYCLWKLHSLKLITYFWPLLQSQTMALLSLINSNFWKWGFQYLHQVNFVIQIRGPPYAHKRRQLSLQRGVKIAAFTVLKLQKIFKCVWTLYNRNIYLSKEFKIINLWSLFSFFRWILKLHHQGLCVQEDLYCTHRFESFSWITDKLYG